MGKKSVREIIDGILRRKEATEERAFTSEEIETMKESKELRLPVNLPPKPGDSRRFKKEKKP